MTKDTGGSAFPIVEQRNSIGDITAYFEGGMSLRDYFAGMALQGCLSYSHYNESWGDYHNNGSKEDLAKLAYEHADAMIEARNKK